MSGRAKVIDDVLWRLLEDGNAEYESGEHFSVTLSNLALNRASVGERGCVLLFGTMKRLSSLTGRLSGHIGKRPIPAALVDELSMNFVTVKELKTKLAACLKKDGDVEDELLPCIQGYDPKREFVLVRAYLKNTRAGDAILLWDVVAYDGEAARVAQEQLGPQAPPGHIVPPDQLLDAVRLASPVPKGQAFPVAMVRKAIASQLCAWCGQARTTQDACGGCKMVYYDSRECQRSDWTAHKKVCKCLAAFAAELSAAEARAGEDAETGAADAPPSASPSTNEDAKA